MLELVENFSLLQVVLYTFLTTLFKFTNYFAKSGSHITGRTSVEDAEENAGM
jgi:hypothetical protein